MDLNEAKHILNKNGYLIESKDEDIFDKLMKCAMLMFEQDPEFGEDFVKNNIDELEFLVGSQYMTPRKALKKVYDNYLKRNEEN